MGHRYLLRRIRTFIYFRIFPSIYRPTQRYSARKPSIEIMLSKTFLFLAACLVVGCQAERLQHQSIRRSESIRTANALDNGKEENAPDAETWLRRLQRHDTPPVMPNDGPSDFPSLSPVTGPPTATVPSDEAPTTGAPSTAPSSVPPPTASTFPSDVSGFFSIVTLVDFTVVVTSDNNNPADESQLKATLEDYLTARMRDVYPNAVAVRLQPPRLRQRRKLQKTSTVDYTAMIGFSSTVPPPAQDVQALEQALLLDIAAVQAAVGANLAIGQNVRVEQVAFDDKSAVALPGFSMVITSDDSDQVNESQLTKTLEDYLTAGLVQDYPDVEDVMLQAQQLQQGSIVFFSGHALFSGSAPSFRDVQSLGKELLSDTAVQTAVDSNPAIGQNVRVAGVVFDDPGDGDDDDDNTAVIVGVVVGAGAFLLALIAILTSRRRIIAPDFGTTPVRINKVPLSPPPPKDAALDAQGSIGTMDAVAPVRIEEEAPDEGSIGTMDAVAPVKMLLGSLDGIFGSPALPPPPPKDAALDAEGSIGTTDAVAPVRIDEEAPLPPPPPMDAALDAGGSIGTTDAAAPVTIDEEAPLPLPLPLPLSTEEEMNDGEASPCAVASTLPEENKSIATAAGEFHSTSTIFVGDVDEAQSE
jgi:hypothetical protein